MTYDFNILYYIDILKKYRKKIIFLMGIAAFITIISGLFKTPVYTSRCSILLTETPSNPSLTNLSKFMGFPGFSFGNSSANVIISLAKSRRMAEGIYSNFPELRKKPKFNLKLEVYDTTQGTLIVEVKGSEPKLTSDIANFCVKNLDAINAELNITSQRPIVKVLDPAIPATRPDSRQILKYAVLAIIAAFFIGNFIFFGLEYYITLTAGKK